MLLTLKHERGTVVDVPADPETVSFDDPDQSAAFAEVVRKAKPRTTGSIITTITSEDGNSADVDVDLGEMDLKDQDDRIARTNYLSVDDTESTGKGLFRLYRNSKDMCDLETEADAMQQALSEAETITHEEFVRDVDGKEWQDIVATLGYDDDLPVEQDWSVGFAKSYYGGYFPCRIFQHTECNFFFLLPISIEVMHAYEREGKDAFELIRTQRFGRE